VVVALNQSKGIPRSLARAALERDYGPILAWVPTECEPETKVPGADATIDPGGNFPRCGVTFDRF